LVSLPLVNLWDKRKLIWHFSITEIKIRYKASYLGFLWTALEPLLLFTLLYIVFSTLKERSEDYAVYLITGIALFHLFTKGTMGGLNSIKNNGGILKSLNIRKEFFPVISTGTISILMFVDMGVLFGLMAVFGFVPSWTIVLIPITIIFLLLLVLGITYILSAVYIHIRDLGPLWIVFAHSLLFISPIFWSLDEVDGILLEIHKINPLGQIIELTHKIVFGEIPPLTDWVYTFGIVMGILFVGYAIFQKLEGRLVEEL